MRSLQAILLALALGCGAEAPARTDAKNAAAPAPPTKGGEGLATLRSDVPLPLTSFLGAPAESAEAQLLEPVEKGLTLGSCVRFVPDRVFFACKRARQRYGDKTGTFKAIRLEVEDGVVAAIGYEGLLSGTGPVSPEPVLAAVGLTLPEAPKIDSPAKDVRRWSWFNNSARLRIDGKEYRVEFSVVKDDWSRSRLDVVLNQPLTEEQKAKILQPASSAEAEDAPPATPAPTPATPAPTPAAPATPTP